MFFVFVFVFVFCFCLFPVFSVDNVASFSGLSIVDCPFVFFLTFIDNDFSGLQHSSSPYQIDVRESRRNTGNIGLTGMDNPETLATLG